MHANHLQNDFKKVREIAHVLDATVQLCHIIGKEIFWEKLQDFRRENVEKIRKFVGNGFGKCRFLGFRANRLYGDQRKQNQQKQENGYTCRDSNRSTVSRI